MAVRFDDFELDPERYELRRAGELVALEPQVFDVLCFLVEHRDRVVSKEELLDGVWGDRFVSESALTSRIKAVRQALGDDGASQRFVQTLRGRGYRFIATVTGLDEDEPPPSTPDAESVAPSGVITFLLTDVEGSTKLWAADRDAMAASLRVHDEIIRREVEARGGFVFSTAGDSFAVAFSLASNAVQAAAAIQEALEHATWPGPALRIRIGLHLGEAEERGDDYFGPAVNLAARVEDVGHGGQVLLTDQVRAAAGVAALDLGTHSLRDVAEPVQIFQLGDGSFPPLRIVGATNTNLPTAPSRLIGREDVVAEVRQELLTHRLVTLTATGGTGKTRLALAVGEAEQTTFTDGVWFVELTPVTEDDLVPVAVAAAVGLVLGAGDPTTLVADYLAGLDALVILDNCEHLVDACADFVDAFLARPGKSRILATTREFLDVDGERAMRIAPLGTSDESSAAVELFIERASAADAAFSIDAADRATIVQLCRHLDGSPLAIELAAARANVMSPAELLAGIGKRFELLRGGRRRRAKQTLEDTLDWSYQLLDTDEQALFRTMGVFAGSFDLEAVMAIADLGHGEALDLIDSLVAKSLVISERVDDGIRFRLLETTAAYAEDALERDGSSTDVRDRHLDHFIDVCAPFDIGFWPDTQSLERSADRDNIRAAIKWAQQCDRWDDAGRLVYAAASVLEQQPKDLLAMTEECLAGLPDADARAIIGLLNVRVYLSVQHDFAGGPEYVERLEASTDPLVDGLGKFWRSLLELRLDEPERCIELNAAVIDRFAGADESLMVDQLLDAAELVSGWAHAYIGDHDSEFALLASVRERGSAPAPRTILYTEALASLGVAHVYQGDFESALAMADEVDSHDYVSYDGNEIRALAYLAQRDLDAARPLIAEHAAQAATGQLSRKANNTLLLIALLAEAENDIERARHVLTQVENARNPLVVPSLELADRLGSRASFDVGRSRVVEDVLESGRRAIEVLRVEIARRGWGRSETS